MTTAITGMAISQNLHKRKPHFSNKTETIKLASAHMRSLWSWCTDHMLSKFIPKYPVRSVSGRKMIVARVSRRLRMQSGPR